MSSTLPIFTTHAYVLSAFAYSPIGGILDVCLTSTLSYRFDFLAPHLTTPPPPPPPKKKKKKKKKELPDLYRCDHQVSDDKRFIAVNIKFRRIRDLSL